MAAPVAVARADRRPDRRAQLEMQMRGIMTGRGNSLAGVASLAHATKISGITRRTPDSTFAGSRMFRYEQRRERTVDLQAP